MTHMSHDDDPNPHGIIIDWVCFAFPVRECKIRQRKYVLYVCLAFGNYKSKSKI